MKPDALELLADPPPAFGENLVAPELAGTGPDLEFDVEQLPRSTFAPPPVNEPALDYDTVLRELDRLEVKVRILKRAAGLA